MEQRGGQRGCFCKRKATEHPEPRAWARNAHVRSRALARVLLVARSEQSYEQRDTPFTLATYFVELRCRFASFCSMSIRSGWRMLEDVDDNIAYAIR